ncbi:hypothetical protein GCM10010116_54900 [Microbispora rosea subsp. aerata]|nr:hypothetical protein [Microbispora rosea]GGO27389.1 hypothetical protein GCM10010116_54900 [Microbispora rosea subsp. aerata]GIH57642.1 hypothetical protein Mro02_45560 [Microbispora rosea subsp. aerata]GLJ86820.1 hypothetical protein GCM10017588_55610 [Microbispora rosea subsp. aerata]
MRACLAALAAVAIAGLLASQSPAAAHAAVSRTSGHGDRNANHVTIRVGNGVRNIGQLTVGSARNVSGIQQRTVGVAGPANAQSMKCGKRSRFCDVTQRLWASNQEIEVSPPESGKEARRPGKSPKSG